MRFVRAGAQLVRLFAFGAAFSLAIGLACAPFESTPSTSAGADGGADATTSSDAGPGGGDSGGKCETDACNARSCRRYDFEGGDCGADWTLGGDSPAPSNPYARDCNGKRLHIAADDTQDVIASVSVPTPNVAFNAVRVSTRMNLADWDGKPVLVLTLEGKRIAVLKANTDILGDGFLLLCDGGGACSEQVPFPFDEEHVVLIEVTASAATLSVDCVQRAKVAGGKLTPSSYAELAFGHADANPLDGTFDDVAVVFR